MIGLFRSIVNGISSITATDLVPLGHISRSLLRLGSSFRHFSIGQQLRGLLKLSAEKSAEDMADQLVFLSSYIDQ
jgi:hypothetical protein